MDVISQQRLEPTYPEFRRRIQKLDGMLIVGDPPIHIRVVRALATYQEQNIIYDQGRTTPGKIVTNAKGGYSSHCFGYAGDCVPDDPSFPTWVPDWNALDDRWKELLDKATECGLSEGASWRVFPDKPHFYLKELPATPDDNIRYLFAEGGLQTVYQYFDSVVTQSPEIS